MRSAARPEPSHTTTGTGGTSVTYSKTDRIVFVPPSITNATTGILLCVSTIINLPLRRLSELNGVHLRFDTYTAAILN